MSQDTPETVSLQDCSQGERLLSPLARPPRPLGAIPSHAIPDHTLEPQQHAQAATSQSGAADLQAGDPPASLQQPGLPSEAFPGNGAAGPPQVVSEKVATEMLDPDPLIAPILASDGERSKPRKAPSDLEKQAPRVSKRTKGPAPWR